MSLLEAEISSDVVTTATTGTSESSDRVVVVDAAAFVSATRSIQTLFGADFGPCWGDFFCSHGRIRGRMYVVANGILFFSSLLGFERRLCLQFTDISSLVLHRTTSIRIEIADYDTYIFRSFYDREKVLQLLIRLKRIVEKKNTRSSAHSDNNNNNNNNNTNEVDRSERHAVDENFANWEMRYQSEHESGSRSFGLSPKSSLSFPALHTSFSTSSNVDRSGTGTLEESVPLVFNRRRTVSDSVVVQPNVRQRSTNHHHNHHSTLENTTTLPRDGISVQSSMSTIQAAWDEATQTLTATKEVGIASLRIGCTLDEFYALFLKDDATYSFDQYQRKHIHDRDVLITRWTSEEKRHTSSDLVSMQSRALTFTHPIKNSVGLGPFEANTTRRQLLRRYQHLGITIENKTTVEGIPAADTFSVDDFWCVQADGTDHVQLSVSFEINFTKRTMFKNMIEKSVLKETQAWLLGYSAMIQEALAKGKVPVTSPNFGTLAESIETTSGTVNVKKEPRLYLIIYLLTCLSFTLLVLVVVELKMIYRGVCNINDKLTALRI